MKKLLLLALMTSVCAVARADVIEEVQETLEQKVTWAHSSGERFESLADADKDQEEKATFYQMAMNFYQLEKDYLQNLNTVKFLSYLKAHVEPKQCQEDPNRPALISKEIISNLLG